MAGVRHNCHGHAHPPSARSRAADAAGDARGIVAGDESAAVKETLASHRATCNPTAVRAVWKKALAHHFRGPGHPHAARQALPLAIHHLCAAETVGRDNGRERRAHERSAEGSSSELARAQHQARRGKYPATRGLLSHPLRAAGPRCPRASSFGGCQALLRHADSDNTVKASSSEGPAEHRHTPTL